MINYGSWHVIKSRLENTALNGILFGTFTVITSTFLYRYTVLQNATNKATLIKLDFLFFSILLFFLSAFLRYIGHFFFIHLCPNLIQIHKDMDDLLKKSKDTLIDEKEWPETYSNQVTYWNKQNYRFGIGRLYLVINEVVVFLVFLAGVFYFFLAVLPFLRQIIADL